MLIIAKSLEEAGSSLTTDKIAAEIATKNPQKIYSMLVGSGLMRVPDFLKLGISAIKSKKSSEVRTCKTLF
jgi:hypothetical protein